MIQSEIFISDSCKDGQGGSKGNAQAAPSGRVPHLGTGSSDPVGKFGECTGELLFEVLYFSGG